MEVDDLICTWGQQTCREPAVLDHVLLPLFFSEMNRQKHTWWMWCFRKPSKHTQRHINHQMHTHVPPPPNSAYTVSVFISLSSTSKHTLQLILVTTIFPPINDTPTITILVCFMPLLCSLSQILQYLCVQQYFNKEYQNWYMQFFLFLHLWTGFIVWMRKIWHVHINTTLPANGLCFI